MVPKTNFGIYSESRQTKNDGYRQNYTCLKQLKKCVFRQV